MRRSVRIAGLIAGVSSSLLLVGCATYYKASDPQSGKEYFTQDIETMKGGAVQLKDARTGSVVTLQSSEVKEISKKEFEAGLAAPAAAASTPAPAAAPSESK